MSKYLSLMLLLEQCHQLYFRNKKQTVNEVIFSSPIPLLIKHKKKKIVNYFLTICYILRLCHQILFHTSSCSCIQSSNFWIKSYLYPQMRDFSIFIFNYCALLMPSSGFSPYYYYYLLSLKLLFIAQLPRNKCNIAISQL